MKICLILCLLAVSLGEVVDKSLLSMKSKSGMRYEQVMAWSDQLWVEVEGGVRTPRQAEEMFLAETGMAVLDFLIGAGEIQLAVENGVLDPTKVVTPAGVFPAP